MMLIPGEQFAFVEFLVSEELLGAGPRVGMGYEQLLRSSYPLIPENVAAQVKLAFAPNPDRENRNIHPVEFPKERSFSVPLVIEGMVVHVHEELIPVPTIDVLPFRLVLQCYDPHDPNEREKKSRDAALVHPVSVKICRPVVRNDCS